MKKVTAYEDGRGRVHKTREECAVADLQHSLTNASSIDCAEILRKRATIIKILHEIDAPEPPESR